MKKKRYLPFGYRMIGGRIEIISEESDLVQNIFCSYLAGASLQQLAKLAEPVSYTHLTLPTNSRV